MNQETVRKSLAGLKLPGSEQDLVTAGVVGEIEIDGAEVTIGLTLEGLSLEARHALEDEVIAAVENLDGVEEALLDVVSGDVEAPAAPKQAEAGLTVHSGGSGSGGARPQASAPQYSVKPSSSPLSQIRHLLAVASGKGGVGKSTVAVNLALALAARGARVGICDIDIYGPSVPTLLGVADSKPGVSPDEKRFVPVDAYGLKVMSIGFLVDDDTPVIWRGPIVASVVKQFLEDVAWGELDYLVIDLPPGTGDAQLTLTQSAPLTGALIVTTPSELALMDAVKGLQMFRKVDIPVLGLVENMSHYICQSCGHESNPFNSGGTERISKQLGIDVLTQIPIDDTIQRGGDTGKPVVAISPDGPQSQAFLTLADAIRKKCPIEVEEEKKKGFLAGLFGR
jgi:ATP-binding protein involved in chromosome partitioning